MRGRRAEVIDIFCGVGGLSAGFRNAGFKVLAGVDLDASCKYAFEKNVRAKFIAGDVADISTDRLQKLYSTTKPRIIVGCAPCQPFSLYTRRYRKDATAANSDSRWQLLGEFGRLIEEIGPDIVSMENVPRVSLHPVFKDFVNRLQTAGYVVSYQKVRADHYGVPQRRNRLVLFASRFGKIDLIEPTHLNRPVTVREAIGSLPPLQAGQAHPNDRLHACRGLGEQNLRRLRATKEGGSWRDWDESLQLACHKRAGGKSFRAVYGRMKWDEPAPVITTQCLGIGNGRFGHPAQDRAISVREAALLQSFPADFDFLAPDEEFNGLKLARQIGNAVPVRLGEVVAQSIANHLSIHSAEVRQ